MRERRARYDNAASTRAQRVRERLPALLTRANVRRLIQLGDANQRVRLIEQLTATLERARQQEQALRDHFQQQADTWAEVRVMTERNDRQRGTASELSRSCRTRFFAHTQERAMLDSDRARLESALESVSLRAQVAEELLVQKKREVRRTCVTPIAAASPHGIPHSTHISARLPACLPACMHACMACCMACGCV